MSQIVRGVIARAKGAPVTVENIVIPDPGPGVGVGDIGERHVGALECSLHIV